MMPHVTEFWLPCVACLECQELFWRTALRLRRAVEDNPELAGIPVSTHPGPVCCQQCGGREFYETSALIRETKTTRPFLWIFRCSVVTYECLRRSSLRKA